MTCVLLLSLVSMNIFLIAGEASGDLHASRLMRALKELDPSVTFSGVGGPAMEAEGLTSVIAIDQLNVVGFAEIARNYTRLRRLLTTTCESLEHIKPDVVVPVDFPGFNTRVSAFARSRNIPVMWYIAPQLWAWGKGRAASFARVIDELLVVLPFEQEFFRQFSITTHFVGHPLLDNPELSQTPPSLDLREHLVAFLPGSRTQEIRRHMPLMRETALMLRKADPSLRFGLARSVSVSASLLAEYNHDALFEVFDNARELMKTARIGLIKTGTSTLEAALCGLPMCSVYKTSTLTYLMARALVTLPSIALPNILASKQFVKEFIQHDATSDKIAHEILHLLRNTNDAQSMCDEFSQIRVLLGSTGASKRAAEHILRRAQSRKAVA